MNIDTKVYRKHETPTFANTVLGAVPSVVYNEDCVEALKRFSDNHFDLAIVDPPYGIQYHKEQKKGGKGRSKLFKIIVPLLLILVVIFFITKYNKQLK